MDGSSFSSSFPSLLHERHQHNPAFTATIVWKRRELGGAIFNPPAALLESLQAAWEEDGEDAGDTGGKEGVCGDRRKFRCHGEEGGGGVSAAAAVSRPPAGLRSDRRTRMKMNENGAVRYEPIHVFMYTKEAKLSLHSSAALHNSTFMATVHT